jgi:hypothetical protein
VGERIGVYRILVGKRRWEKYIKMDLQEVGCSDMDWIELDQDKDS